MPIGKGLSVRIKLFTVPGQVIHNATRRLVLQGADGVAFIADSQRAETKSNAAAFVNKPFRMLADQLGIEGAVVDHQIDHDLKAQLVGLRQRRLELLFQWLL